jgi:hypothetical protein
VSAMTGKDLKRLLQGLEDTDEIVLQRAAPGFELLAAWRAARDDARRAYGAWRAQRDRIAFSVYRAAEDRADAALAALRAACSPSSSDARSTMSPTGR